MRFVISEFFKEYNTIYILGLRVHVMWHISMTAGGTRRSKSSNQGSMYPMYLTRVRLQRKKALGSETDLGDPYATTTH